jgi:hypothetical protein
MNIAVIGTGYVELVLGTGLADFGWIAELRRRLKLLFGTFPSTSGSNEGIEVREGELFDSGHVHYFTLSMLEKLYRKYGIKPLYRYGFGRLGHLHNLRPSLLSSAICIKGVKK